MNFLEAFTQSSDVYLTFTPSPQAFGAGPKTGKEWIEYFSHKKGKKKGQPVDDLLFEPCTITDEGIVNSEGTLAYKKQTPKEYDEECEKIIQQME